MTVYSIRLGKLSVFTKIVRFHNQFCYKASVCLPELRAVTLGTAFVKTNTIVSKKEMQKQKTRAIKTAVHVAERNYNKMVHLVITS